MPDPWAPSTSPHQHPIPPSASEVIVDVELLQINTKKLTEIGTRITDSYSGVYTGGGTSTSTGGSGGSGGWRTCGRGTARGR